MPLAPDSPEFARLATRWLDGVCSREEAERLWAAIGESHACARAFAEMTRFELLLETTSTEMAREAVVAIVAEQKGTQHRRRMIVRQTLKIAALALVLGSVLWFLWPETEPGVTPSHIIAEAKAPQPVLVQRPGQPDRLLITPPTAATAVKAKPLPQHLNDFFLTALHFDKTPLRDAVRQLEAQMRSLNFARASDLDRLHIALPASALGREITFHSENISFLKALRAIAALADCDVNVTDTSMALSTRPMPPNAPVENRAVASLIAADGIGRHSSIDDLLTDARALGMIAGDGQNRPTQLTGTAAQFEALSHMADSRRQINQLPDLSFLAFLMPSGTHDQSRVLTTAEQKALASRATNVQTITVDPGAPSTTPASLHVTAVPAGDGYQITVSPSQPATPATDSQSLPLNTDTAAPLVAALPESLGQKLPVDALVSPGQGFVIPFASSVVPVTGTAAAYNGPTLTLADTSFSIAGGANLPTLDSGTVASGNALTFNGNMTNNTATISKAASGTLTLTGQNSYAGGLDIMPGELTITSGTVTFDTAALATRGRTVSTDGNGTWTITNTATGTTSSLRVTGSASLVIIPATTTTSGSSNP